MDLSIIEKGLVVEQNRTTGDLCRPVDHRILSERLVVVKFDATMSDPHGSINHRVLPKVRIEETGATNVYPTRALQDY